LKERVLEAARQSAVAAQVEDIALEPDCDDDGTDFLRVVVSVTNNDRREDAGFEELLETVEQVVGDVDERYPRVRFADAA
jgi:hypothetical protein